MTYDTLDKDGNVKTLPLFTRLYPAIHIELPQWSSTRYSVRPDHIGRHREGHIYW
jgi:hypothetical protein